MSVCVNVRAASRKLFTSDIVEKRDHQISSIVVENENEGVHTVCVMCMYMCVCVSARI